MDPPNLFLLKPSRRGLRTCPIIPFPPAHLPPAFALTPFASNVCSLTAPWQGISKTQKVKTPFLRARGGKLPESLFHKKLSVSEKEFN